MTKGDQSTNPEGTDVYIPRVFSMPEPGKYLLGGNPALVRNIKDYKSILHQIPKSMIKDPAEFGRRLCGLLMRQEFSKEELATKNVTGFTRHTNKQIIPLPKLDPVIMEAIFEQARHQSNSDISTIEGGRNKTLTYLNDICRKARRDIHVAMNLK